MTSRLNRVSSVKHYEWLKDAIVERCKTRVIGYLPKDTSIEIPERHLGLVTSKENCLKKDFIKRITYLVNQYIDLELLLKIALPVDRKRFYLEQKEKKVVTASDSSVKIGVAHDEAFSFYYQDNFEILKQFGAELIYFSPLRDISLPAEFLLGI